MTADPKNPNADIPESEAADEALETVETTVVVASDEPVEGVLTDEAGKEERDVEPPELARPAQESGSGGRGLFVLLVVVLCVAAGASGAVLGPRLLPAISNPGLAALQSEVAALQSEVTALKSAPDQSAALATRVTAVEGQLAALDGLQARLSDAELALAALASETPVADTQRLDALTARIDTLESAPAVPLQTVDGGDALAQIKNGDLALLRDRARALIERIEALPQGSLAGLATLDDRLLALDAATRANAAAFEQIADVDTTIGTLGDQVAALEASLATLENRAVDPGSAFVLATGQLRDAVATGAAYRARLDATTALAPDDGAAASSLQTLVSHADTGVATNKSLGTRLPDAISAAVTAEHVANSDGWVDEVLANLAGLVSVRRIDGQVEGSNAEAVTARAEARFNEGDVDGALKELEGLSDEAATAMSGWIDDAKANSDVHKALEELHGRAIALVGGTVN
ncbi:MAG: COG4223 family protein [Alphaproteobacteria bacterium]|jgi:hypothetical protein